jgi:chemotaxis protein CheD
MRVNPLEEFKNFNIINVLPGKHYVTTNPNEVVHTLLGSCISACMRDPASGVGGLNHFLLPAPKVEGNYGTKDQAMRYGDYAMEMLVGSIIRAGGNRNNLEVKVFGGANMYDLSAKKTVGQSNIQFVLDFISEEGLTFLAEDIGGTQARKIYFHPSTGKVKVQRIQSQKVDELKTHETSYTNKINKDSDIGTIELFG